MMTIAQAVQEERNIKEEIVQKLGLKSSDAINGGVQFPYIKHGITVNNKHRTFGTEKRFCQDEGGEKCFYNYDVITNPDLRDAPLFITEGEYDALSLIQAGYERTVSVPDGAPNEELLANDDYEGVKYSYVEDALDDLCDVKQIVLCIDNDSKGNNLFNDLVSLLGPARCKRMVYPKGCKDANDVLREYGEKGIHACVKKSQWVELDDLLTFDVIEDIPDKPTFDIGIPGFEQHVKMRMGDFWVLTGIPSHGKTTFLNDVLCRVADKHDFKICISSFEQNVKPDFRRNLRCWYNQKPEAKQSIQELAKADDWIKDHFIFIKPNYKNRMVFDLNWILSRMTAAVVRHNCKVFVIDPWNELDHLKPGPMSLTEYVGHAIKEIKRFCMRHDVLVCVVAHPVKPMMNKDNKLMKPNLYSISDSSHWYNKADLGIVVHRDKAKGSSVTIAKSRYHDKIGIPGEVFVIFNPESYRFMVDETQS
jgi:twinkle protein